MAAQMESTFGIDPADIIKISAKTGAGVEEILKAVVERIPPPSGEQADPLKAFLFDSLYVQLPLLLLSTPLMLPPGMIGTAALYP